MTKDSLELQDLIQQEYVPTAMERKKSLLMYFFIGIFVGLSNRKTSNYEKYHLKQALGWRGSFFFFLVVSIFMIFLPYIRIIPVVLFLFMMVIWGFFVKQAWEGYYVYGKEKKIILPFFHGIGGWVLDLFDINELKNSEHLDSE